MKSWIFIAVQAMLIVLIVFVGDTNSRSYAETVVATITKIVGFFGLFLTAVDLAKKQALTALPDPNSKAQLQTHGLYKYTRHPMYTSVLLLMFGIAIGSPVRLAVWAGLGGLLYFKARYEEELLMQKFNSYEKYQKKTGMFLPRLRKEPRS